MNAYLTQWSGLTAHARTAAPCPNRARFIVLPFVLGGRMVLGLPVAQAATSSIEQVTVYQGLASVTR